MGKKTTLTDIAKKTGVSTVTVSNALADRPGVSEDIRKLIKKTALDMEYNKTVKHVETTKEKTLNIGVLVADRYIGLHSSFYWELYQKVVRVSVARECLIMLEVLEEEMEDSMQSPRLLKEHKVDGLIVMGWLQKSYITMLVQTCSVPLLFLDFYDDDIRCNSVTSSGMWGTFLMTNYLFDMGHKEIAFVGNIKATGSILDRYMGYRKSLMMHQVKERQDWIVSDRDTKSGKMKVVLPEQMPTAFVCNSDFAASYLVEELKAQGYRVPEDISVVGFDNYLYGNTLADRLTTYDVNMEAMAKLSLKALQKQIRREDTYIGERVVEGKMIIRESVREIR